MKKEHYCALKKDYDKLIGLLEKTYIVVEWPESQQFMDEDWFEDEAILDSNCVFGYSAYFIPSKRILNKLEHG